MKKIILALSLCFASSSLFAWTIGPMNYQGRLLDNNGIPVTGTYNFTVNIFDALTGGTLKFSELQSNIVVNDGVYSFLVSTGVTQSGTWDINLWNTPSLYLEIIVNGQTLTPRHLLASTPFAFQANLALTTNNALALGGVSATQYQNTLASICVSGKGKWLELVSKCLGIGSSFPGPTRVNWNTLTASNDFSNLDLSRADISGIDFFGANLQKTIFYQTTYAVQGLGAADLSNSHWDAAIAIDATPVGNAPSKLNGAYFANMDMSKWSLYVNLSDMAGMSAANLSACPAALPSSWECRLMYPAGSKYFLLGQGVNLSANSAAASVTNGYSFLDLDVNALLGAMLFRASFEGVLVTQNLTNPSLSSPMNLVQADFNYATLKNILLVANVASATFNNTKFSNVSIGSPGSCVNGSYINAELSSVVVNTCMYGADFTSATLRDVTFTDTVDTANFTSSVLINVAIDKTLSNSTFNGTHFYNGLFVANLYSGNSNTFNNVFFSGGRLSGNFLWQVFTGTITFQNVVFDHVNLCSATIPLVDKTVPSADLKNDFWGAAVCPNGHLLTGAGDTCNTATRMTSSSGSCDTASIP